MQYPIKTLQDTQLQETQYNLSHQESNQKSKGAKVSLAIKVQIRAISIVQKEKEATAFSQKGQLQTTSQSVPNKHKNKACKQIPKPNHHPAKSHKTQSLPKRTKSQKNKPKPRQKHHCISKWSGADFCTFAFCKPKPLQSCHKTRFKIYLKRYSKTPRSSPCQCGRKINVWQCAVKLKLRKCVRR